MTMMDIRGQPSSAWSADWRYGNITWTAAVSINSPMPSRYEDQILHWPPSSQFTTCYEDQIFHWLTLQSVHLLLWRLNISLATPPVSSSPVQKYNPAHSFMQTFISSNQTTFWEGGWGEGGGSNKIKQHVPCDQITQKQASGTTQTTPNFKYSLHSCNEIIHITAQVLNLHQSYFWFSRSLQLTNPIL